MKENYSAMCENILNNLNDKKKLLLHSCCGPCSSYVISYLTKYFDITILYYNPNIFPYDEYLKRKEEQIKLINEIDKVNCVDIIDCDYDTDYNYFAQAQEIYLVQSLDILTIQPLTAFLRNLKAKSGLILFNFSSITLSIISKTSSSILLLKKASSYL